ncbi:LFA3 protein, partial [Todus mexicanus]|nr:LFA3 protein [Todus mexicanus]
VAHIHCEEVYGILGENFTFPVTIDRKIQEITWKKNKDIVVEWEEQDDPTYFASLQNRGLLNTANGRLTIYNLESSDAGTYVLGTAKTSDEFNFKLIVLDPPREHKIRCSNSGDDLVLQCTADFQKPLIYTWKLHILARTYGTQNISIAKKNTDASEKATCSIKFSQMEKSTEILLAPCLS